LNIYTLLATLGGLFVLAHTVSAICNTIIAKSYHNALIRINEVNNLSQMEITYTPEHSLSRFGVDDDDDDGFLN
jgi:hypothetical protein